MCSTIRNRALTLLVLAICLVAASGRLNADTATCGGQSITLPFTDVPAANNFFCSIAQIYFQGITLGTGPGTYSPADFVTREQMAAFLSRTQNSTLNHGGRRAALNQFWTTTPQYPITQGAGMLGTTAVSSPRHVASDGTDLWIANITGNSVSRVRASDGKLLETWTGATTAWALVVAMGRVFVTGLTNPGKLYVIDPSQPAGGVTTLSSALGDGPRGIAFDGQRIWTANSDGSVSIITPGFPSFTVSNVHANFALFGILYDGANIWVTDGAASGHIYKLNASGVVVSTVDLGGGTGFAVYDGTNIWALNANSNSVSVVRPSDGTVLATLTGNGLTAPVAAAFDGQRILITNAGGNSVSLFRAADFSSLGTFSTGASSQPFGACSDGLYFWITLTGPNQLARF